MDVATVVSASIGLVAVAVGSSATWLSEAKGRDFLNGDELKEIPASRKKRLVILRWLVNKFDFGVQYPEAQVNEIIKRHHPDFATLRREFIGNGLMERENAVYWRVEDKVEDKIEDKD